MDAIFCMFLRSLLILVASPFSSSSHLLYSLKKGSSLSVEKPDHLLASPNGTFAAGFHRVGNNAYCFAAWYNDPSCPSNCTIIWTANRDKPVNGKHSKLSLLGTGNLVLNDADGSTIWSTSTENYTLNSLTLRLQESGNLVLVNESGFVVWQSFDAPTDTLLPGQTLNRRAMLVSSRSRTDSSSGFYKLSFDEHNVLVLHYDGPDTSSSFWPTGQSVLPRDIGRSTYNSSRIAVLDDLGKFASSDNLTVFTADYGVRIQRRFTLDFDGNLRIYSRNNVSGSDWDVSWQAMINPCKIHGSCGPNSSCSIVPKSGIKTCSCLPGFRRIDEMNWFLGCKPKFDVSCVTYNIDYLPLSHVESDGYDFGFYVNTTLDKCKQICSERCDCKGFMFKFSFSGNPDNIPYCFPKTQLLNGYRSPSFRGVLYLKVPKSNRNFSNIIKIQQQTLACPATIQEPLYREYETDPNNSSLKFLIWFVSAVGIVEISAMILVWMFLIRNKESKAVGGQIFQLADTGFKRFNYAELKKATRNFRQEIGRGASGVVYKGELPDGRVAAIKRLHESEQGESEFLAEVSAIGGLNHMHLIDMWGYCAEGKHRLLVYEYMEHGSLAQNLSSKTLDWKQRFQISVATAKGLAYLHEECLEWVLHCDLKPQNILLDANYQPKVSDFGLSKSVNRDDKSSSFSGIRGTRGYMAPEWVYRLPITAKVDVYSYGVVVLEMVTGKSPMMGVSSRESEGLEENVRLVNWVRENMKTGSGEKSGIKEILDPCIACNCELDEVRNVVEVALQCVEEDMNARPSMSQVVQMLASKCLEVSASLIS